MPFFSFCHYIDKLLNIAPSATGTDRVRLVFYDSSQSAFFTEQQHTASTCRLLQPILRSSASYHFWIIKRGLPPRPPPLPSRASYGVRYVHGVLNYMAYMPCCILKYNCGRFSSLLYKLCI